MILLCFVAYKHCRLYNIGGERPQYSREALSVRTSWLGELHACAGRVTPTFSLSAHFRTTSKLLPYKIQFQLKAELSVAKTVLSFAVVIWQIAVLSFSITYTISAAVAPQVWNLISVMFGGQLCPL